MEPKGWYNRGYLPHFDGGEITQAVTFSLVDAFPVWMLPQWRSELAHLPEIEAEIELHRRIDDCLDAGQGKTWLADPFLADMVQQALFFFSGKRYLLQAWVVMPTHVHTLFTPIHGYRLETILHSWKSFTANRANEYLRQDGAFWVHESFDRFIRSEEHFANEIAYIEMNPVKAGLCAVPADWRWSSARFEFNRLSGYQP